MLNHRKLRVSLAAGLLVALVMLVPSALAQANTVQVGLVEYAINMPATVEAGSITFEVTNNGTMEHNFEIEGQGMEEVFESNLQPGETMTMQVDLQPGTYTVYCPVGNHRELGMEIQLAVTEAGGAQQATPAATAPAAATPQEPATTLPQTGGVNLPWTGITLAAVGGLVLLGGLGLALVLALRERPR
jgi:uncharacterized cupredoxin-like copper-binding protein